MRKLIYSFLYKDGVSPHSAADLQDMAEIWEASLRGPGRFTGDIKLLEPTTFHQGFPKTTARVTSYEAVPFPDYDAVLHIDLDAIAVGDVNTLFPTDDRFWVAPSNLRTIEPFHTLNITSSTEQFLRKIISSRARGLGISASIFSARSSVFPEYMRKWDAITRALHGKLENPMSVEDQGYLNVLYLRHSIPFHVYDREVIQHKDHKLTKRARIFHFAGAPNRVQTMHDALSKITT